MSSSEHSEPVVNFAKGNVVRPRDDAFPYPQATVPVAISGLDHVGLDFPDLEAAERWYVNVLGAKILVRRGWGGGVNPAKPHTDIQFGEGSGRSIISMFIGEPTPLKRGASLHFAFHCENIDELEAWKAHLDSHGVKNEIWGHYGCGAISTYFRDPWDHHLEITTWSPDWPSAEKLLRERGYRFMGEGGIFPTN